MIKLKTTTTGLILAIASVLALNSCINEEYSIKNIDDSIKIMPGIALNKEAHYEIPLHTGLGIGEEIWAPLHTFSNGDYYLKAYSTYYQTEAAQCSFYIFNDGIPIKLEDAGMTIEFNGYLVGQLLSMGTILYAPIMISLDNITNVEGKLSILVHNFRNETLEFNDIELKPGINDITLDSEALMQYIANNYLYPIQLDFTVTPTNGPYPPTYCQITTSALVPIEIMPGQEINFDHAGNIWNGNLSIDDIPPSMLYNRTVLSLDLSVENNIPAELIINIPEDTDGNNARIEGLKPIQAGSLEAPSITEMSWKIEAPRGLEYAFSFQITAKITGDKPVPLNDRYGLKFNMKSIQLL